MNYKSFIRLATLITVFLLPVKGIADNSILQISQQAEQYLYSIYSSELPLARTVIKLNPPPSMDLRACTVPITFIHTPSRSTRATLRAQCTAPKWSFFLSATIEQWAAIATTTRPLGKGTILGSQDFFLQETDVRQLNRPYFINPGELLGREIKHNIGRHQPIIPTYLKKHYLIREGDMVYIEASNKTLHIRMTGTALENGIRGEQIGIRNNRSGKTVRAYVTGKGVVSVTP